MLLLVFFLIGVYASAAGSQDFLCVQVGRVLEAGQIDSSPVDVEASRTEGSLPTRAI